MVMRRSSLGLSFCLGLLSCAFVQGKEDYFSPDPNSPSSAVNYQLLEKMKLQRWMYDVGLGISYYRYVEPGLIKISGPMFHLKGAFSYARKLLKTQFELSYDTHVGSNRYDGFLQTQDTEVIPYKARSTDWYINGVGRVGISLFDKREIFFAYTGLGYRFLRNRVIDNPGVRASYRRYQGYLYLPIGISGEIPLNYRISLTSSLEYRLLLYGHNTSTFTDIGYDRDLNFRQLSGNGGVLNLGVRYYLTPIHSVKINLYWDFWSIDPSNTQSASLNGRIGFFIEPRNYTNNFGIHVGFSF